MLLGPVVDVALQAASLRVLRLDQPAARGLELVGACLEVVVTVLQLGPQPHQPQHETGLGREVGEQPFLHGRERQARPLLEPQLTEYPVAVQDRQRAQALRTDREPVHAESSRVDRLRAASVRPWSGCRTPGARPAPTERPCPGRAVATCGPGDPRCRRSPTLSVNLVRTSYGVAIRQRWPVRARPAPGANASATDGGGEHRQSRTRRVGAADQHPTAQHDQHVDAENEGDQTQDDDRATCPTPVQVRRSHRAGFELLGPLASR